MTRSTSRPRRPWRGGSCARGARTSRARARYALSLCQCRPPRPEQVEPIVSLYAAELDRYRKDRAAAAALATDPIGPLPPGADAGRPRRMDRRRQCPLEPRQRLEQGMIPAMGLQRSESRGPFPLDWQQVAGLTPPPVPQGLADRPGGRRAGAAARAVADGRAPAGEPGPVGRRSAVRNRPPPITRWCRVRRISLPGRSG